MSLITRWLPPLRRCLVEELQHPLGRRLLGLLGDRNVPVFRPRQAFFQIARGRGRVRGVAAGDDQRGNIEAHEILGFGAGRGVAVEQGAAHAGDDELVGVDVLLGVGSAKARSCLMTEAQGPPRGSPPNGLPSLVTSATTASRPFCCTKARCSAKRWWLLRRYLAPPTGQYSSRLSVVCGMQRRRTPSRRSSAHAAAHDVRALDAEMIEQAFALRDVMRPGHALDAAARLAAFAAVEHDAGVFLRQVIEQLDLGVDALRASTSRSSR